MAKTKSKKTTEETPAPSSSLKPPPLMFRALTHEQIANRAYELYMKRGSSEGTPESDWVKAELELRATIIDTN